MKNNESKKKRLIIIGACSFVAVAIIVSAIALIMRWYNHQTQIVEIVNYPSGLSNDIKDEMEIQLRRVLESGVSVSEGQFVRGEVREGSYLDLIDSGIHSASFLLDIDDYKQTFLVNANWSDEIEIPNPVLVSCPNVNDMKYPEEKCLAMYNSTQEMENIDNNPIYNELPIIVDEFNFASRSSVHYEIRGYFDENNKLVIVINDYSGGNHENALEKIRKLGHKIDGYEIKYVDHGGEFD